jgi:DNA-binding transcriptional regulator YhcF (GntR family)
MGKQQTQKKLKVVGTQQFVNVRTGEIEDFQVTSVEERDFNFHKVWMKNFINTLEIVGNQKSKLCFWIIDNLNRDNQLCMTYRQIAEKTHISLDTVRVTMKLLLEADFLRRVNQGCYVVNPDIVFKGSRNGRLNVLNTYTDAEKHEASEVSVDDKIKSLQATIASLTEALEKLVSEKAAQSSETDQLPGQLNLLDLENEAC